MRKDYIKASLDVSDLKDDPVAQFVEWFEQILHYDELEANAFVLSTCDAEGQPHGRVVLLKGIEEGRFVFYSNYGSAKAKEMNENAKVAATFYWPHLERQVRIEGTVKKVAAQVSDKYFDSRPEESKIGAWASAQSAPLTSRKALEDNFNHWAKQFEGKTIHRPDHWGGYSISAMRFEFWQGRSNRLHDRFRYELHDGAWKISRLSP
jgi:pyridoxamine 5'-phosphate oxidase